MPVIEETTPATPAANKSFSLVKGILAGSLLTIAFIGAAVWLSTGVGLLHLMGFMRTGGMRINVDQPTVVRQIQQLQKLETVSYTMDRILLVVHGEVVAGVNLANIKGTDVSVQGHNISLRLPPAEVFSTRIDNAKSRVYSRDTGLFSSPDPNLESEVREEAERQLQQSAVVGGILKSADQNARNTVTGMLTGLGFTQVALQ